jgi:hypothetical protein
MHLIGIYKVFRILFILTFVILYKIISIRNLIISIGKVMKTLVF